MEIIFELEDSDLEIDFTPDFDWMYKKHPGKNRADYSKVQWELSDPGSKGTLAVVQYEFSDEKPINVSSPKTNDV
mgnify:CR=1 FL=1|tara:strand:- start:188 stop:412 length:225 start_codon:yes stop_codon:yes gene_type:complete